MQQIYRRTIRYSTGLSAPDDEIELSDQGGFVGVRIFMHPYNRQTRNFVEHITAFTLSYEDCRELRDMLDRLQAGKASADE